MKNQHTAYDDDDGDDDAQEKRNSNRRRKKSTRTNMKSDEAHSHKTHGGAYGGEIAPVVTH